MDDMPLVVLPYMKHGDLLTYIRDEKNVSTVKVDVIMGLEHHELLYMDRNFHAPASKDRGYILPLSVRLSVCTNLT